jgi:hypothetical protein
MALAHDILPVVARSQQTTKQSSVYLHAGKRLLRHLGYFLATTEGIDERAGSMAAVKYGPQRIYLHHDQFLEHGPLYGSYELSEESHGKTS